METTVQSWRLKFLGVMQKTGSNTAAGGSDTSLVSRPDVNSLAERKRWLQDALHAMQEELAEDQFSAAAGHFREALCLSQGIPELKTVADEQASLQLERLLPRNWRVVETLVHEATSIEPPFLLDSDWDGKLDRAREDELIIRAIYQADRTKQEDKPEQARATIKALSEQYPNEKRLREWLSSFDRPEVIRRESPATGNVAVVKSDAPRSPLSMSSAKGTGRPGSPVVVIPNSVWNSVKNFVTLAATTGMLGGAGFLLWQHFAETAPPRKPKFDVALKNPVVTSPVPNATQPPAIPAPDPISPADTMTIPPADLDEKAWQLVKTSDDAASIQSFLAAYPGSPHALRAKLRLASLQWKAVDKNNPQALQAYLRLHPRTPYRAEAQQLINASSRVDTPAISDRDAILDAVRQYRRESGSVPLPDPVIENDHATLTLPSGDNNQAILYTLSKQDGLWKVESVR